MTPNTGSASPDTTNVMLVGAMGDDVVILTGRMRMTREEALNMAAWIVALFDHDDTFEPLLAAVKRT